MADHRMRGMATVIMRRMLPLLIALALSACATNGHNAKGDERLIKEGVPRTPEWKVEPKEPANELQPPAFVSMPEDIIPFKTKIVNIVVRNSPLRDVLYIIADASGLNLLTDRDVPLDLPMTLSLRNATAEEALKTVVASADCFFSITNNVIKVESVGTRIFELGHPALINSYTMDVGGNISGAGMSGSVKLGGRADDKAQDFWGSLETSLNSIFDKKDTPAAQPSATPGDVIAKPVTRSGSGPTQQSITINRLTGTIMVTASRKNIEKIERYLDSVRKVLNRQVMIEARILEVTLKDEMNFGIDWAYVDNSLNAGFGSLNRVTDIGDAIATAVGASKFRVGVSKAHFQGLLTALKTQGEIKTLSNPKINVMNGHPSILTVGTNTSFISKVTTTTVATPAGNSISFAPETSSVLSGMIIGIVPFISEKGDISLNITPITSDLLRLQDKTFGTAGNQVTITIPTVALREMTTTVKMRDGQMVIIGGLISKSNSSTEEKVPILGDLPYLGKLFTRISTLESRSELVLLLQPHIVDND